MGDSMKFRKKHIIIFVIIFAFLLISTNMVSTRKLSEGLLSGTFHNKTKSVFEDFEPIRLPVLMYHSINPKQEKAGKYVITPENFENDLKYLKEKGYTSITAKELVKYVNLCEPLPEKPIMITFDDGMYNNMEYALPLLEKYGYSAVFSIVGSYADEYTKSDIVNPDYSYLRWADIKELSGNPYLEFGNHSYNFHSISKGRYGTEKKKSESSLEYIDVFYEDTQKLQSEFLENCNFKPFIYTYPFGSYSDESYRVLKKMGILVTFSCTQGINKITHNPDCLYMIKRYNRDGNISTYDFFKNLKI